MTPTRHHRSLIAWMLYGCLLFNLLACGIHHGQMSGLQLSGLGGQFCSDDAPHSAGLDGDLGDSATSVWSSLFSCPLCASITLSLALLFGLTWLLRPGRTPLSAREDDSQSHPRYAWPPANPRAP